MLKKRIFVILTAILTVMLVLNFTACTGGSGRSFTDVTKVEDWLANQKGGTSPDVPVSFSVKLDLQNMASSESNWQKLLASINTVGLYVALDLSGSTMPSTEFNADGGIIAGKQFIVSLVLPDNAESVSGILYSQFANLKNAKARNIDWFIGGPGPASGIVFYDKGDTLSGWRYLEAAHADMETTLRWVAQSYGDNWRSFPNVETGTAIGTGRKNTALILAVDPSAPAAKACTDYRGLGFSDWFLPSIDELDLMYKVLKVNNIGGLENNWYWSSSQSSAFGAWYQFFFDGYQTNSNKNNMVTVRAIRAF